MPIYEYQCQNCGHELEAIQKFSDAPLTDCPKCQSNELKKKVSAAGFRLSGGGWYETDFKSGDKKNLAGDKDASSKSSGEASKDSGKSDKKGESAGTKSDSKSTAAKAAKS